MKKYAILMIIPLALILIFLACSVRADEYVVNPNGGGYASIQDAVQDASPGSTIRISPGVYNESVLLDKALTIVGSGTESTILQPAYGYGIKITADHVSVSDLYVNGTVEEETIGILVDGSRKTTIYNVSATNFTKGISLERTENVSIRDVRIAKSLRGVYVRDSHGITMEKMDVLHCGTGIDLMASNSILIRNNTVFFSRGYGTRIVSSTNISILDNVISETGYSGIYVWYSDNNNLRGNNVSNTDIGIYLKYSNSNALELNELFNTPVPIRLWESYDCHLLNNTMSVESEYLFLPESHIEGSVVSANHVEITYPWDINPASITLDLFNIPETTITGAAVHGNVIILSVEDLPAFPPYPMTMYMGLEDVFGNIIPQTVFELEDRLPPYITDARTSDEGVWIYWSETINETTLDPAFFVLSTSTQLEVVDIEHHEHSSLLVLDRHLEGNECPVLNFIGGVEDLSSNPSGEQIIICRDGIPPTLISASTVTTRQIRLIFSEPIQTVNREMFYVSSSPIASIRQNDSVVILDLEVEQKPYYTPTISITSGVRDLYDNPIHPISSFLTTDGVPNVPPLLLDPRAAPSDPVEGDTLILSVIYRDEDNEAPAWVKARIVGPLNRTVDMIWDQGDYATGVVASTSLDDLLAGSYYVSFSCSDGKSMYTIPSVTTIQISRPERKIASISTPTPIIVLDPALKREGFVPFIVANTGDVEFSAVVHTSIPSSWRPSIQGAYYLDVNREYPGTLYFTIPREISRGIYNHTLTFTPSGGGASGVLQFSVEVLRGEVGSVSMTFPDAMRGKSTEIVVMVENTGDGILQEASLVVYDGGQNIANLNLPDIESGENITIRIPWTPSSKGNRIVSVIVNSDSGEASSFRSVSVSDVPIRFSLFAPDRIYVLVAGALFSSIFWVFVIVQMRKRYKRKKMREEYVI